MGTGPIIGSCAVVDLGFNFGEDWNVAKNKTSRLPELYYLFLYSNCILM